MGRGAGATALDGGAPFFLYSALARNKTRIGALCDHKTMQLASWHPLVFLPIYLMLGLYITTGPTVHAARVTYYNMYLKYREMSAVYVPFTPAASDNPFTTNGQPPPKLSNVFVHTGKRSLLFTVPLATTLVRELKAVAFFREHNTGGAAIEDHALIKKRGAYLSDEHTLEQCEVEHNQTLALIARLRGGAPTLDDKIGALQESLHTCTTTLNKPGLSDAQRARWETLYKQDQEELFELYRDKGVIPNDLEERDDALVNPPALQPTGGRSSPTWMDVDSGDDGGGGDDTGVDMGVDEHGDGITEEAGVWVNANKNPAADPRTRKLGRQWIPDDILKAGVRESDVNPNGRNAAWDPSDDEWEEFKEQLMGARQLDHTMTGFSDDRDDDVIQKIGIKFMMGRKQADVIRDNNDGTITRVLTCLLNSMPLPACSISVLNVMLGRAQGGKSYEGVTDCWAKFFVHGVLPIYYVRNQGGLNDTNEICKDFTNFNNDICAYLDTLAKESPARYGWLAEDNQKWRFCLSPKLMCDNQSNFDKQRVGLEVEYVPVKDVDKDWAAQITATDGALPEVCVKLTRPQVMVGLMNKSTIVKFMQQGLRLPEGYSGFELSADYKVNKGCASVPLAGSNKSPARLSPFSLLFGVHNVVHTFERGKRPSPQGGLTVHPGKCLLHSAYPPCAWDMTSPYDKAVNAKRGRVSRLVDEVDTTTSDNKKHAIGALNNGPRPRDEDDDAPHNPDANWLQRKANHALDPASYAKYTKAHGDRLEKQDSMSQLEGRLKLVKDDLDRLRRGEEPLGNAKVQQVAARDARAAARVAGSPGAGAASGPNYEEYDSDEFEEALDADEDSDADLADSTEDGDDTASIGSSASTAARRQQERIGRFEAQADTLQDKIDKLDGERKQFEDAERKAMGAASGYITGMQAAAMYNVGITATIFGCMQRHEGGKTQTRLTKMPTPDAYNDLATRTLKEGGDATNDDDYEERMLVDPKQPAKPGSIRIKLAPVKRLGFFDLNASANRNRFIEKWMLKHNRAHRAPAPDPDDPASRGEVIPEAPVTRRGFTGSYTIPKLAYEEPKSRDAVPWVVNMMEDFTKAKKMQSKRMHNSWARNEELFVTGLDELQDQRPRLKTSRRCAQGLMISGETRFVKSKDHLIADLFVRCGNGVDGDTDKRQPMNDVCCYNYSGERLSLYFREDALDPALVENIINDPDDFLPKLRAYLEGDPTMHYSYPNKDGVLKTKLSDEWLKSHYIKPIRETLQRCVARQPPTEQQLARHEVDKTAAKTLGKDPPEYPKGRIKLIQDEVICKDALYDREVGRCHLTRLDFAKPTPQPRYMATLFTIIDAHRFHEDPDNMLPMPFVGMTKTAGGRAQRYMCHGYRSRIQVHVHTFDIFPHRRCGLAMCDAIQEGFRPAGFDENERAAAGHGLEGEWMDNWVKQVYVSTEDFVPLLQNALQSQEEWSRMLTKEQRPGIRSADENPSGVAETAEEYRKRMLESPSDCLERVIGGEVVECFKRALKVWTVDQREPTRDNIDFETDYPNLHTWLLSHVNRAAQTRLRFLRHANQDTNEASIREYISKLCRDYLQAEVDSVGDAGNAVRDKFLERAEELDAEHDLLECEQSYKDKIIQENRQRTTREFIGKLPLPRYSAAHAPGGALDERDRKEQEHYHLALRELLQGRDTIAEQYEASFGPGMALQHARNKTLQNVQRLQDGAALMKSEGVVTDGGPEKYDYFRVKTINKYLDDRNGKRPARRRGQTRLTVESLGGGKTVPDYSELEAIRELGREAVAAVEDHCPVVADEEMAVGFLYGTFDKDDPKRDQVDRIKRIFQLHPVPMQNGPHTQIRHYPNTSHANSSMLAEKSIDVGGAYALLIRDKAWPSTNVDSQWDMRMSLKWACRALIQKAGVVAAGNKPSGDVTTSMFNVFGRLIEKQQAIRRRDLEADAARDVSDPLHWAGSVDPKNDVNWKRYVLKKNPDACRDDPSYQNLDGQGSNNAEAGPP